jgi:hypothetical protein
MVGLRKLLGMKFPSGSTVRWMITGINLNPLLFPVSLLRSFRSSLLLTGRLWPISVRIGVGQKFDIFTAKNADVKIDGVLFVNSWGGSRENSSISLGYNSKLYILGDFEFGPGVHVFVGNDATLKIGGAGDKS